MITARQLMKLNTTQEALEILCYARNSYINALQARAGYIAPRAVFEHITPPFANPLDLFRTSVIYETLIVEGKRKQIRIDPIVIWLHKLDLDNSWIHYYRGKAIIDGFAKDHAPMVLRLYVKKLDERYEKGIL